MASGHYQDKIGSLGRLLSYQSFDSATPRPMSARRAGRTSSAVNAAIGAEDGTDFVATPRPPGTMPALPQAAQVTKARRIRLYRNGDSFYDGMVVVLAPENFRTFDSLLSFINRSPLADPSILKKGVRFLFTTDGQVICSLDQLTDGGSYVCASTTAFRRLPYESIQSPTWIKEFKARIKGIGEFGPDDETTPRDYIVPRTVCVFRAGPRPRNRVKMLLNRRTARTYDQLLTDIAHAVHEPCAIKSIYATSGRQALTLKDFFLEETVFVTFGAEKYSVEQLTVSEEESKYISKTMARKIRSPGLRRVSSSRVSVSVQSAPAVESMSTTTQGSDGASTTDPPGDEEGEVPTDLLQKYQLGKVLYKANAVTIKRCEDRLKESQLVLVVRIFDKTELSKTQRVNVATEASILRQLHHPNLVEVLSEQDCEARLCQVFELSLGVDLLEYVNGLSKYTEKDVSRLVAQLMSGLNHLHSLNVIHRNVKPSNIIVDQSADGGKPLLKLYDFGLAGLATSTMQAVCGTPTFMAPEMIRGSGYGVKADIWSAGVISYILLCGFPPFIGTSDEDLFRKISSGGLTFPSPWWDSISNLAKDLIVFMLEEYPQVRSSASEVIDHPWVSRDIAAEQDIKPLVADNLIKLIEATCVFSKQPALSLIATSSLDKSSFHFRSLSPRFDSPMTSSLAPPTSAVAGESLSAAFPAEPPSAANEVNTNSNWGKSSLTDVNQRESYGVGGAATASPRCASVKSLTNKLASILAIEPGGEPVFAAASDDH